MVTGPFAPLVAALLFAAQVDAAIPRLEHAVQLADDARLLRGLGVATDGPGLVDFLHRHVGEQRQATSLVGLPGVAPDHAAAWRTEVRLRAALARMAGPDLREREQGAAELNAAGPAALPLLNGAGQAGDLLLARRSRRCAEVIEGRRSEAALAAAVRLLRHHRPPGSTAALLELAPFAPSARLTEEALTALWEQGVAPDNRAALAAALAEGPAARRAAAALVLGRFGAAPEQARVRGFLDAAAPAVRLRAAQGLLAAGDPEAAQTLLDLLREDNGHWARTADALLRQLKQEPPARLAPRLVSFYRQVHGSVQITEIVDGTSCTLLIEELDRVRLRDVVLTLVPEADRNQCQSHHTWVTWWHEHGAARLPRRADALGPNPAPAVADDLLLLESLTLVR